MKYGDIPVGDISIFLAVKLASPAPKFHVCVAPGAFFLVNTRAIWQGSLPILKEEFPFLEYDSFIGCGHLIQYPLEDEVQGYGRRGKLSAGLLNKLILHLNREVKSLSRAQYRMVARHLMKLSKAPT